MQAEVAIVGGGPAGAALATLLGRLGIGVMVLEAAATPKEKFGECLAPNVAALLERLGLAPYMDADGHLPSYGNRSLWGSDTPVEQDFIFHPFGHGWHLNRRLFEERLVATARTAGAEWRTAHRVIRCREDAAGVDLEVESSESTGLVRTEIVVDATGRSASIARRLGARQMRQHPLIGSMAVIEPGRRNVQSDSHTLVEAMEHGWWYSALRGDGSLVAGVMTDPETAPRRRETWQALLDRGPHTRARIRPQVTAIPARIHARAAGPARLDRFCGRRWLAIGDAAAAFDPISSYGIGSALGSAFEAADAIAAQRRGVARAFRRFEAALEVAWHRCEAMRRDCYARERRWPDSAFWRRRARAPWSGS